MSPPRTMVTLAFTALLGVTVSACSGSSGGTNGTAGTADTVKVVASFYPVQYAVEQIGGSHVSVTSLTKPGAEPHDIELSPKDVAAVSDADLITYAAGFQPAVDEAVSQEGSNHALDLAPAADLTLAAPAEGGAPAAAGAKDPHFWLDPQRFEAVGKQIGARLAQVDPTHAADYAAGTARFVTQLTQLDAELKAGTASCARTDLVTSHAAFGYLAQRYGFTQVPITGLDPEVEPSGSVLAEITDFVRAHGVTTIYAETLVEPKFAETIARTTGATVATLDPIEGITSASKGQTYPEVMRADLAALRAGQGCS
ncbi:MAG: metal ABC transporter substrate-binding protein [Actinomycetota bacterium]|nr:metal ABC transporter substrate-binding protein [Actinomycetota bacterium]